jgi:hypothetical protein
MTSIIDMRINEVFEDETNPQTFRQYIRDLEMQSGLPKENLDKMNNDEILEYIDSLYVIALIM